MLYKSVIWIHISSQYWSSPSPSYPSRTSQGTNRVPSALEQLPTSDLFHTKCRATSILSPLHISDGHSVKFAKFTGFDPLHSAFIFYLLSLLPTPGCGCCGCCLTLGAQVSQFALAVSPPRVHHHTPPGHPPSFQSVPPYPYSILENLRFSKPLKFRGLESWTLHQFRDIHWKTHCVSIMAPINK